MREMLRGNLSMNLGAPAPLPAGCLWKIRRQGCRRSQKRLVGSEGSLFRGILSPSDRETVSEGRVRVSVFARSHSSGWLSKKEEPELSSRLFVRFDPSLRFDSDPSGLNGGNRVLGRGCIRGPARAIGHGARTGRCTHSERAAGMKPQRVARRPAAQRPPARSQAGEPPLAADNTVPDG